MRRFCQCELSRDLSSDDVAMAGDALRALEQSPAWFLICRKVEQLREGNKTSKHPNQLTMADYGVAHGTDTACDAFLLLFDEISREAADARERKYHEPGGA